ncbi:MAG: FadR/GntR family transcriptional regulator [Desulfobacteraceae bacterium]
MAAEFSQITRSHSLSDEVAARLKESILNRQYQPGDAMPSENQMAEQFGVSRVVVREALKELKSKGLIEIRRGPKGGPFVTQHDKLNFGEQFSDMIRLGRMSVEQLFEVRLLVEPEIVRLLIKNLADEQTTVLREQVAREKAEPNPQKRKDLNVDFHRQLGRLSGNPFYAILMDSFMDFVDRFITTINPGTFDVHDKHIHEKITEAIAARDEVKAVTLVRSHLVDTRDKMMAQEQDFLSQSGRVSS